MIARGIAVALACALAPPALAWSPATNYRLHCEGCHLADGSATPGKVPALAGSVARFSHSAEGREYLVRVPGVANATLDDADLAALLDWTLRRFDLAHLAPGFAPYTAEEVARWRRQPLVDVTAARRRLLDRE